jgi:hypothetical protein
MLCRSLWLWGRSWFSAVCLGFYDCVFPCFFEYVIVKLALVSNQIINIYKILKVRCLEAEN